MEETVGPVSKCGRVVAAERPNGEYQDVYSVSPEFVGHTLLVW
jgi:hypothetical protein